MKVEAFHHPMMIEIGGSLSYVTSHITTAPDPKGTVLCLHEFTARGALFQPLADVLASDGWKVVAPDLPGRGQSQRLPSQLYTWHSYVHVLAAALRLHALGPLVILGVGWGAILAVGLENLWRPKPARLVLCDLPITWQFTTDSRTQLMARLCQIVGETDAHFMDQTRALVHSAPEMAPDMATDVLRDVARRLTGPQGARSLGADPRIFDTLPRDPKASFSSLPLLRACTTPTDLLYSDAAGFVPVPPMGQQVQRIAAANFFDLSDKAILQTLRETVHADA